MAGLKSTLIKSLRNYILDREELNQLNLNQLELKDPELEEAVIDGAQAYDLIPPLSTTDLAIIDTVSKEWYLIKQMAAIEALQRLVFLHIRNRNPSNDQGFAVDEFGKATDWDNIRTKLRDQLYQDIMRYKRLVNIQSLPFSTISLS